MQIESIKMFCDLCETKSFTKAAQISNITQSAVSQQVRAIERHFSCVLIERSKKQFRLTQEGEIFFKYASALIRNYEELSSKLQEVRNDISGTIRLATIYSVGLHDLPPYLKYYLKVFPRVSVQVEYRRANQVYEDVLSNVVDVGMIACPSPNSKLQITPLHEDEMVLIVSPEHPFAQRRSVFVRELNGEKFVGFENGTPTRTSVDNMLASNKVKVQISMEFDNVETIKRAVEINNGLSIVPKRTVFRESQSGSVIIVKINDLNFTRPVVALTRKDKVLSPAMKAFIEILKQSGVGQNNSQE